MSQFIGEFGKVSRWIHEDFKQRFQVESMKNLKLVRWLTAFVVFGLVVSGITAFPLRWEVDLLASYWPAPQEHVTSVWIGKVQNGLNVTSESFPFLFYGTDWLAFAHLIIALFFVPVWIDPARYRANIVVGLIACFAVVPLAMICGPIRGIPFFWQLIDCSFGVICGFALTWMLRLTRKENGSPGPF